MSRVVLVTGMVLLGCLLLAMPGVTAGASEGAPPSVADESGSEHGAGAAAAALLVNTTEQEPNDDAATATPIQPGDIVNGEVAARDDVDIFTVDASQGDTLRVDVSRYAGAGSVLVYLYGPDGTPITGSVASAGGQTSLAATVQQTGVHYVLLASNEDAGGGTGRYAVQASISPLSDDPPADGAPASEVEPNDDRLNATAATVGSRPSGELSSRDDDDFYRVLLDAGETVTVGLARTGGTGTFLVGAFDEYDVLNGTEVAANGRGAFQFTAPDAGTYFVVVGGDAPTASDDPTGAYTLAITAAGGGGSPPPGSTTQPDDGDGTDEGEPNDDPASATAIDRGTDVSGAVSGPEDLDWFTVSATDGEELGVTLARSGGDGQVAIGVYNPSGAWLGGIAVNPDQSGEFAPLANETGTYHVVVYSYGGGTGDYTFDVAAPAGDSPPPVTGGNTEVEPNDGTATATRIDPETPVTGEIPTADDNDVFSFDAAEGDLVVAQLTVTSGGPLIYTIFNSSGVQAIDGVVADETSGTVQIQHVADRTGTHYVVVSPADGGTGSYSVTMRRPGANTSAVSAEAGRAGGAPA